MSPSTEFPKDILVIVILALLNGLFVAAEFALVRVNPNHFTSAEGRKKLGSITSLSLIETLETSLASVQLGITVASILLGWYGVQTLFEALLYWVSPSGASIAGVYTEAILLLFALGLVIFVHVVIGELAAKAIAVRYPESVLRFLSLPVYVLVQACRPLIYSLNHAASLILKLFGIDRDAKASRAQSLAELSFLVSKSTEGGLLDEEEEQMLRGVFGLSDTVAREVMTPRTDLVTLSVGASFEEVLSIIRESGLSRFPVVGESVDDVQGVLLARDVLSFVVPGLMQTNSQKAEFNLKKLAREAYFIPGTKPIDDLLTEFKKRKLHLAVVLDEHGGVDGVVTLEDLIEEIVGDIFDESDFPEKSIVVQSDGVVLIDGGQLVADLNSRFSLEIPEGDYDTIAGYIFTTLGRMPRPGDSLVVDKSHVELLASSDAVTSDAEQVESRQNESEQLSNKALIQVEKVQSYRIETVSLRPILESDKTESAVHSPTSNPQEPVSDR